MLCFLVTPCLVVAVQPCMVWIPIEKKIPIGFIVDFEHGFCLLKIFHLFIHGMTYSSCFICVIVACMRLPFFQNIFKFGTFLLKFSSILPFFWKITCMPFLKSALVYMFLCFNLLFMMQIFFSFHFNFFSIVPCSWHSWYCCRIHKRYYCCKAILIDYMCIIVFVW